MVLASTCQATFHACRGKVDSLASFKNKYTESTIEKFEKFVTALLIGYLLVSSSLPKNFNKIQYKKDSPRILFNSKASPFVVCYFKIFYSLILYFTANILLFFTTYYKITLNSLLFHDNNEQFVTLRNINCIFISMVLR
ncbi:hypothetical protein AC623_09605 [Bacillus sp. FJAT-27231]|nr:hypothetical protein AC623_09605 [Bacillus sp. FJAT-27231]